MVAVKDPTVIILAFYRFNQILFSHFICNYNIYHYFSSNPKTFNCQNFTLLRALNFDFFIFFTSYFIILIYYNLDDCNILYFVSGENIINNILYKMVKT